MPWRPSMRGLAAFDAVMRTGSFAAAADELNVTASAVSHRIKGLEAFLGVQLFNRVHRQATPSEAAIEYHAHIGRAFADIERATVRLVSMSREDALFVHASPTFATQWLMPRLSGFFQAYPELDVRVTATPQPADPEKDDIDVDIRYGDRYGPGIVAEPLCEEWVIPMASPSLFAGGGADGLDLLRRETLIHSTKCLVQWSDWLARYAPDLALDLTRGPKFDRSFLSIGTAKDGLGVCLESTLLSFPDLESGALVPLFGMQGIAIKGHYLAVPRQKRGLDKILHFRRWLRAELERASNWVSPLLSDSP